MSTKNRTNKKQSAGKAQSDRKRPNNTNVFPDNQSSGADAEEMGGRANNNDDSDSKLAEINGPAKN